VADHLVDRHGQLAHLVQVFDGGLSVQVSGHDAVREVQKVPNPLLELLARQFLAFHLRLEAPSHAVEADPQETDLVAAAGVGTSLEVALSQVSRDSGQAQEGIGEPAGDEGREEQGA